MCVGMVEVCVGDGGGVCRDGEVCVVMVCVRDGGCV